MQLVIEINNYKKLDFLVELLRSFDYVKSIHITDAAIKKIQQKGSNSFFHRYYGSQRTGDTMENIDHKLNKMRNEWERDIF